MTPFLTQLVRRASGIENLAGLAWLIGCTLVLQWSARLRGGRKLAAIGLLASLTMLGCFVKFPLLAPLPIWLWLWSRWDRSIQPLGWPLPAALGALIVLGLSLGYDGQAAGLFGTAATSAVSSNAARFATLLSFWMVNLGHALIPLLGAQLAYRLWTARELVSADARGALGKKLKDRSISQLVPALRGFHAPLLDRLRWTFGALALAVVGIAPSLLNGEYYADYYLLSAMPPLTALAAKVLTRAAHLSRLGVLPALAAAGLPVPFADFSATFVPTSQNRASAWVRELGDFVRASSEPKRLALQLDCKAGKASPEDEEDLLQLFLASGESHGIRWAVGWRHADVVVFGQPGAEPEPDDLVVGYCLGEPLRLVKSPGGKNKG